MVAGRLSGAMAADTDTGGEREELAMSGVLETTAAEEIDEVATNSGVSEVVVVVEMI